MKLIDLDLSIPSAAPKAHDCCVRQIRMEYTFVPEEAYRAACVAVLKSFDQRTVFKTTRFFSSEPRAHENLLREIERLGL